MGDRLSNSPITTPRHPDFVRRSRDIGGYLARRVWRTSLYWSDERLATFPGAASLTCCAMGFCVLTNESAAGYSCPMRVSVLFFGVLKELMGRASEVVELPPGATVENLLTQYRGQMQTPSALAIAVNRHYAQPDRLLQDGDEVAFLPPVSGGA